MALVTANQFDLGVDASRLAAGLQQGQQFKQQRQAKKQQQRASQFASGALEGSEEDLSSLAGVDPQRATQIQQFLANQSDVDREEALRENEVLTRGALNALSLPPEKRREFVQSQRNEFAAAGRDTTRTDRMLSMDDAQMNQLLQIQAREGQSIKALAEQQFPKQAATTTLQKNLIAAGLKPGTPEFEAEVLKSINKPTTQVTIGGDKTFAKEVAKGHAKNLSKIREEADTAIDVNQSLDVLENIDVNTGALEPAKQAIASFGKAFGMDTSGIANVAAGEGFNAEAKRLVLAVKASQKGPQTDKDEATIRSTVANLGNTKEGNQFIIDSARALNDRRIERKDFYDNFLEETGGKFRNEAGKTADAAWSKFKRNTPMVSKNLRTPEGLPVFFYKFEQDVRNANPDASRAEILEAWRATDKRRK